MDTAKARIRRGYESILSFKKRGGPQTQEQSPLFQLPPEIRESIWQFTLSPARNSKSPHFHIYDEVYDSCLYDSRILWNESKERLRDRTPRQMSLLLTCRAAYSEANRMLYEDTHFALVLLAGNPRGYTHARHCLGSIKDCRQLFSRMKDVTLVAQPGSKRPDAEKYAARVTELLEAMDYMRHAEKFQLTFNFHAQLFQYAGAKQRFGTILKPFYAINRHSLHFSASIQQFLHFDTDITDLQTELLHAIAGPDAFSKIPTSGGISMTDKCAWRGASGWQPGPTPATNKWQDGVIYVFLGIAVGSYLATLPVSIPLTYLRLVKRKMDKGEDDVWKPWKIV